MSTVRDPDQKKLSQWIRRGEYQKVMDAVEAVPAGRRSFDSILMAGMARCWQEGIEKEIRRAVDWRVEAEEQPEPPSAARCFLTGCVLTLLEREGEAMDWFRQAGEQLPGNPDVETMVNGCRRRLSRTVFDQPFARRVEHVWEAFAGQEEEMRALLGKPQEDEAAAEELLRRLGEVFGGMLCASGILLRNLPGTGAEIIFHPMMGEAALWPLHCLVRQAPEGIREHWKFQIGLPSEENPEETAGEVTLRPEDVQVQIRPSRLGQNMLDLTCYCEKLAPLLEQEPQAENAVGNLLMRVLGEMNLRGVTGNLTVSREPLSGGCVPLNRLVRKLEIMGQKLDWDAERYLYDRVATIQLTPGPEKGLRRDCTSIASRCIQLDREYRMLQSVTADMLRQDGIECGFLYWPASSDPEENRRFLDQAQEELLSRAGKDVLTPVGTCIGTEYSYLDLIIWDMPRMLDAGKAWARTSGRKWVSYHTFHWDAEPVVLWRQPKKSRR